jgi:hypothetical protein
MNVAASARSTGSGRRMAGKSRVELPMLFCIGLLFQFFNGCSWNPFTGLLFASDSEAKWRSLQWTYSDLTCKRGRASLRDWNSQLIGKSQGSQLPNRIVCATAKQKPQP